MQFPSDGVIFCLLHRQKPSSEILLNPAAHAELSTVLDLFDSLQSDFSDSDKVKIDTVAVDVSY